MPTETKYEPIISNSPHMLHGGDYNPDQWLHSPEIIDEDFRIAKIAGVNSFSICIFGWSAIEPEEGKYTFDWLDGIMDRIAAEGGNAILSTPSAAKPAWLGTKYPETRRVDRNGHREPHRGRANHCYSSPIYREKVANINRRMAERYANHPALGMWHISNEYHGTCYCELCQDNFRKWLKERYGSLEKLNEAWWTSFWSHKFNSWDEINPFDHIIECQVVDWKRFVNYMTLDFYLHEKAAVKEFSENIPVVINMMGFFESVDYYKFAPHVDVVTDDCYPQFCADEHLVDKAVNTAFTHDMHRAMKNGKPWMLMESCPTATNWQPVSKLKAPGIHTLEMMQAVAHGADGCLYFQYRKSRGCGEKLHGAVIDHVGHENTRVFEEIAAVGKILGRMDNVIGTTTETEVALIYDWENRWAIHASAGPNNKKHEHQDKGYLQECQAHYHSFWQQGIPVDVIESTADFSSYKLIIIPMLFMTRDGVAERIREFVENGGTAVMTYLSGIVDQRVLCHLGGWPGAGLREVFGIWAEEIDAPYDFEEHSISMNSKSGFTGTFKAKTYCDLIHAENAEVLATYNEDFYKGRPAVTVNEFGKGKAYYIAFRGDGNDFYRDFYEKLADDSSLKTDWHHKLPEGVCVRHRGTGDERITFIMNFTGKPSTLELGEESYTDIVSNQKVTGNIPLNPWQVLVLR
jgi:beta-galactosidase